MKFHVDDYVRAGNLFLLHSTVHLDNVLYRIQYIERELAVVLELILSNCIKYNAVLQQGSLCFTKKGVFFQFNRSELFVFSMR